MEAPKVIAAVTATTEDLDEWHEVEVDEEMTNSEYPHDDLEDDEDDKNAKTRETPLYIVS